MMKRLFLTLACALAVLTAPAAGGQCGAMSLLGAGCANSAPPSALLTNLISFWPLDEASGNALDPHGGLTGVETSGTIGAAAGPGGVNGSRDFEVGDTEMFVVADNPLLDMGDIDFSVSAFVQLESKPASLMGVSGKYVVSGNQRGYVLYWDNTVDRFKFLLSSDGGGVNVGECIASTFGAPSLATWYFLVGTYNAATDFIGCSVNASAQTPVSFAGGAFSNTGAFQIGNFSAALHWDGLIAQNGVWKRLLSAGEQTWLYNSGTGRTYADIVACVGC